MARQFDICRTDDGVLVVVVQSDILMHLPTRVVVPLISSKDMNTSFKTLMPVILEDDSKMHLFPQQMATVMTTSLVSHIGSAKHLREDIIRATDLLLTGY
jgi:toxin CcdB